MNLLRSHSVGCRVTFCSRGQKQFQNALGDKYNIFSVIIPTVNVNPQYGGKKVGKTCNTRYLHDWKVELKRTEVHGKNTDVAEGCGIRVIKRNEVLFHWSERGRLRKWPSSASRRFPPMPPFPRAPWET